MKNNLIRPEGTKDYIYEEASSVTNITEELSAILKARCYNKVITPLIEFMDVFPNIPVEDMFKLVDFKGRLLVVRPDSTMPIARLCKTRLKDKNQPIRLFYSQPVYSNNNTLRGLSNEVLQLGMEIIGNKSVLADLEAISLASECLERCSEYRIEIGHIGLFNNAVSNLDISDEQKEEIRLLTQTKNYTQLYDLLKSLPKSEYVEALMELPKLFGGKEVFQKANTIFTDDVSKEILEYMENLYKHLCELDIKNISVDLGVVNRNDYYSGVLFKGYIEGFGQEVLTGGRYDDLVSEGLGAIGFAMNIDAIVETIDKAEPLPKSIMVYANEGYELKALNYVKELSKQQPAELCLIKELQPAMKYAQNKPVKEIHIIDETVTIERKIL